MSRTAGWTLIELLLVAALLGVLGALAAPALNHALVRQRVISAGNAFVGALHHARTLAIGSGARVILCPSRDGWQCVAHTRWDGGWLLALDRDHDDEPDAAPVLRGAADPMLRVVSTRGRTRLRFLPTGSAAGSNTTFTLCQTGFPGSARLLVISNSGRVRQAAAGRDAAAACAAL